MGFFLFKHMKRIILLLIMGFSSIGLSCQTNNFKTVDVAEFAKAVADTSYIVLDVRTPAEHAEGHIPGTHFNIDVLDDNYTETALKSLPKDKKVALYCRSGNRSKNAARILAEKGYQVLELGTGFRGWVSEGKDTTK
jgi:rhodanese-related sulfurtransferase